MRFINVNYRKLHVNYREFIRCLIIIHENSRLIHARIFTGYSRSFKKMNY